MLPALSVATPSGSVNRAALPVPSTVPQPPGRPARLVKAYGVKVDCARLRSIVRTRATHVRIGCAQIHLFIATLYSISSFGGQTKNGCISLLTSDGVA